VKPLCYAPFIGLYASSRVGYAPCCVSEKFKSAGPEEFWSGEDLSRIRSDLLNGVFPDSCSHCAKRASLGLKSDVDHWNNEYDAVGRPEVTGLDPMQPLILDYRPSNQCNLKCRMCGSAASSSIENEVRHNPELAEWYGSPKTELDISDKMIEYVSRLNLVKVKILGGEPSIDPGVWDFMNVAANLKKKPALKITTNGTSLNPNFIKLLNKFDKVEVTFSVDAVGDTYDYIRTNARWKNTEKNILSFISQNPNVKVGFNVVLSPYNIFSLNPLIDWMHGVWFSGYKIYVNFDDSDDPHTGLPAVLSEHIESALYSLDTKKLDSLRAKELVYILENASFDPKAHASFKRFCSTLDRVRKTKLIDLDGRFHDYIEEATV
jgi:sulfatase maturation enzyme AslB (radical SAM superfamily)